jgi:hypothetical protein
MTKVLAVEMQAEVVEAIDRASKQAENPEVRRVGVVHVKNIGGAVEIGDELAVKATSARN